MPSPTISVGCEALLDRHGVDLVGRHAVGEHRVEVERGADGLGRVGAVAGDHDDARHAGRRAACCTARGVSRRSSSPSSSAPIVRPSTDTNTLSAERQDARRSARTAQSSGLRAP